MNTPNEQEEYETTIGLLDFVLVLLAFALGALAAAYVLPIWMPHMADSLVGGNPKAYWYLSRGSAFVALSLMWLSMALGLLITNKMARIWPGAPAAFAVHEYVSLLGLAFAIFHALILMGDKYIHFSLLQVLVPFTALSYRPIWTGLGQTMFYIWLLVALSFYVRRLIGQKTWRVIHYVSFLCYIVALVHGLMSGTDTSMPWAQTYYWVSGGSLIFLLVYRILVSIFKPARPARPAPQAFPARRPTTPEA